MLGNKGFLQFPIICSSFTPDSSLARIIFYIHISTNSVFVMNYVFFQVINVLFTMLLSFRWSLTCRVFNIRVSINIKILFKGILRCFFFFFLLYTSKFFWKWKKVKLLSCVQLFVTLWTVARRVLYPWDFSRQDYWNGLPFLSPGDLPDPGIEPRSLPFPELTG